MSVKIASENKAAVFLHCIVPQPLQDLAEIAIISTGNTVSDFKTRYCIFLIMNSFYCFLAFFILRKWYNSCTINK